MITKDNQTNVYLNSIIRDAIHLIRKGESAIIYAKTDVIQLIKIFGEDNIHIEFVSNEKAKELFDCDMSLYFISYSNEILKRMAELISYMEDKLFILKDMGFNLTKDEIKHMKDLHTKSDIEHYFWTLYDRYTDCN